MFTWERYKDGKVAVFCEGQDEIQRFLKLEEENAREYRCHHKFGLEDWETATFRNEGYVLEEVFGWYTEDDFGMGYGVSEEVRFRDVPELTGCDTQIDFDEGDFISMLGV